MGSRQSPRQRVLPCGVDLPSLPVGSENQRRNNSVTRSQVSAEPTCESAAQQGSGAIVHKLLRAWRGASSADAGDSEKRLSRPLDGAETPPHRVALRRERHHQSKPAWTAGYR